jgi:site-specific recombinase XerD
MFAKLTCNGPLAQLAEQLTLNSSEYARLLSTFLESRREGLSPRTIEFYTKFLRKSKPVVGIKVSGKDITCFLKSLKCTNSGKHGYYRALRAFYNWLYSPKSGYNLNPQDNPVLAVDSPKIERKILPSLSPEQLEYLIEQAESTRDKAIICLFADSGLRLSELAAIKVSDIDWDNRLIKVRCKGNKEGFALYGEITERLMREWLTYRNGHDRLWDINHWGISIMLRRLKTRTGLPCNPHTFRRTFATILAKRGVDSLHIMRLGRWESLEMVQRYTRALTFHDSLKFYKAPLS